MNLAERIKRLEHAAGTGCRGCREMNDRVFLAEGESDACPDCGRQRDPGTFKRLGGIDFERV